jgi:TIR domain
MCNIFISHKHEDKLAAKEIAKLLRTFGGDSLKVFISEEIYAGENWRKVIVDKLSKSNLLLLLFTEPRLSWDWCLYETGLFMNLKGDDRRKVICIHTPITDPPDQIRHLEAIPAQETDIKDKFLKVLFGETIWTGKPKPINSRFAENDEFLDSTARSICSFFEPKETDSKFINRYLILLINEPARFSNGPIPGDAMVRSKHLENVFGVAGDQAKWQLIAETQTDSRWIHQLNTAINTTIKGLLPDQIQATFRSKKNGVIRPILYRVDTLSSGAMEFYLLLVSDVAGKGENIPNELMTMATILRMGTRFRYEVIENYQYEIQRSQNESEISAVLDNIRESINNIESEARSRMSIISQKSLRQLYKSKEDKERIVQMFDDWNKARHQLFNIEKAMERDPLLAIFENLRQMNGEFMCFTSKRYNELVEEKMC